MTGIDHLKQTTQADAQLQIKEETSEVDVKDEDESRGQAGGTDEVKEGSKKRKSSKKNSTPPRDGDTGTFANWAVQKLRMQNPPFQIGGETVSFESSNLQVRIHPSFKPVAPKHLVWSNFGDRTSAESTQFRCQASA